MKSQPYEAQAWALPRPGDHLRGALSRWWGYRDLVRNLVAKEIKVRYQGAILGFAWSLMNPLMITLMYLIVFTYVFPSPTPHFALYMVTGLVHWTLFSNLIMQASELLTGNSELLKKIYFPRLLVPFSNLLVNLVLWSMALLIFLLLYPVLGGAAHWALLVYPFYLILFVGFCFGLMLTVCVLYVDYRDLKHIIEVFIQLLFWSTPIVYSLTMLPPKARDLLLLSPLAEFVVIFHDIFWGGTVPGYRITLLFVFWTVASLALGMFLFQRRGARLIERL